MVMMELELGSCLVLRFEMGWIRRQVREILGWWFGGLEGRLGVRIREGVGEQAK